MDPHTTLVHGKEIVMSLLKKLFSPAPQARGEEEGEAGEVWPPRVSDGCPRHPLGRRCGSCHMRHCPTRKM